MADKTQRLGEETWGERLRRAYRRCRAQHGITYLAHAEAISEFIPVSDQSIMRYEDRDELPANPRQRQIAYLIILAYGFDPSDWGLTPDTANLGMWDIKKVAKVLDPSRRQQPTSTGKKSPPKSSNSQKEARPTSRNSPRYSATDRGTPRSGASVPAGQTTRAAA